MRLFVSIELPPEVMSSLGTLQKHLKRTDCDVAWTRPENIHLTLKFLGEVEQSAIDRIRQACASAASLQRPFYLALSKTGVFPDLKSPKVLWVGLKGGLDALQKLHVRLENGLSELGFEVEKRQFTPHLTLGRVRSHRNITRLMEELIQYGLPRMEFQVNQIGLIQSQLHPSGSIYTCLAAFGLKGVSQ